MLAATCYAVAVAFSSSSTHAPPARIHAAVNLYAGRNLIAAEYSGVESQRAKVWCCKSQVSLASRFTEKADAA